MTRNILDTLQVEDFGLGDFLELPRLGELKLCHIARLHVDPDRECADGGHAVLQLDRKILLVFRYRYVASVGDLDTEVQDGVALLVGIYRGAVETGKAGHLQILHLGYARCGGAERVEIDVFEPQAEDSPVGDVERHLDPTVGRD